MSMFLTYLVVSYVVVFLVGSKLYAYCVKEINEKGCCHLFGCYDKEGASFFFFFSVLFSPISILIWSIVGVGHFIENTNLFERYANFVNNLSWPKAGDSELENLKKELAELRSAKMTNELAEASKVSQSFTDIVEAVVAKPKKPKKTKATKL